MKVSKWFVVSLLFFAVSAVAETSAPAAESQDLSQNDQLKIGLGLIQQKNYQQAENLFQKLSQQYPDQITYLNNLAVALMAQGKTEQALESLKTAMVSDNLFSVAQKNISQIYAYMASQAYAKALDKEEVPLLPQLDSIADLKIAQEIIPPVSEIKTEISQQADPAPAAADLKTVLENKMSLWANAWMKGDVKAYLSAYSEKFQPGEQLSYKDWLAQRQYRLRNASQVEVSYTDLNIYLNSDKSVALVEFVQQYKAGKYQDRVRKQLYWSLEDKNWLISREQVTEKL